MLIQMGIVGLPNVGKSSLFNLLTEQAIAAENYPFCTIGEKSSRSESYSYYLLWLRNKLLTCTCYRSSDPNEGRCPVPDERYDFLCGLWDPPSKHPAYLHIVDIAGLVKGAAEGAGLGNAFLSHIAAVDGIFHGGSIRSLLGICTHSRSLLVCSRACL